MLSNQLNLSTVWLSGIAISSGGRDNCTEGWLQDNKKAEVITLRPYG